MIWTRFDALLRRPPIGWWDLADILVVSILIYEVLKLIRGTRAVQMAVGGGIIALLFYGSRSWHLDTVNWLVRNLFGYFVFGFIVLFQSDIRRALAHFGRAPFFRYLAKAEARDETIEEAIVRELAEEAGIVAGHRPRLVSMHSNARLFRGDHVLLYRIDQWTVRPATSRGEILRMDWFHPSDLPDATTPGTRRRIAEMLDGGPPDLFW